MTELFIEEAAARQEYLSQQDMSVQQQVPFICLQVAATARKTAGNVCRGIS
jgi:hypothetical protein